MPTKTLKEAPAGARSAIRLDSPPNTHTVVTLQSLSYSFTSLERPSAKTENLRVTRKRLGRKPVVILVDVELSRSFALCLVLRALRTFLCPPILLRQFCDCLIRMTFLHGPIHKRLRDPFFFQSFHLFISFTPPIFLSILKSIHDSLLSKTIFIPQHYSQNVHFQDCLHHPCHRPCCRCPSRPCPPSPIKER